MKMHWFLRRACLCIAFSLILTVVGTTTVFAEETAAPEAVETQTSSMSIRDVVALCRPSVVQIITSQESWNTSTREAETATVGYGSGNYIMTSEDGKGGYVLTNYHVVEVGDSYQILWYNPETQNYDLYMDATLVGYDNGTDIAILKFDQDAPEGAEPIALGDSDSLAIGDTAIVIGHPGAEDQSLYGTVTAGIISGMQRSDINAGNFSRAISLIQVDAAINSGNSGGALLNDAGELVGIPTLKYSAAEGLGFCIPINSVKDYITEIIETGTVKRPRMGIGVNDFDGPDEPMKSYPPAGIMVMSVEDGSPAQEAGLKMYDIITEINGVRVTTYTELTSEIDKCAEGDTVQLKVYRYYDESGNRLSKYEELDVSVELKVLD